MVMTNARHGAILFVSMDTPTIQSINTTDNNNDDECGIADFPESRGRTIRYTCNTTIVSVPLDVLLDSTGAVLVLVSVWCVRFGGMMVWIHRHWRRPVVPVPNRESRRHTFSVVAEMWLYVT